MYFSKIILPPSECFLLFCRVLCFVFQVSKGRKTRLRVRRRRVAENFDESAQRPSPVR